ncbi:MAG: flagellar biosynthetic protein FliQ [Planctomycetaceae bacterium]|jgi:flagellar biosynthetic protein FliQ
MNTLEVVDVGRDLLITTMWLAGPAVLASLLVGLAVSLMQTLTSIQEQTLSFAPRIVAVAVMLLLMLPWMLKVTTSFTMRMMGRMVEVTQ